jgi:hypothetical protein
LAKPFVTDAIFEHEVDHAGNGIRAILRRGAIPQYLHPLQPEGRNLTQISGLRKTTGNQSGAMLPFAVDQNQGVIRRETAQARRTHKCRTFTDREALHIERRHGLDELVGEFG